MRPERSSWGRRAPLFLLVFLFPLALFQSEETRLRNPRCYDRESIQPRISRRLAIEIVATARNGKSLPIWIYLTDKGQRSALSMENALRQAEQNLGQGCLWRRSKVRGEKSCADYADLPLVPAYLEKIIPLVDKVRAKSRWLNAISAEVKPRLISTLARLPCVRKIDLVRSFSRGDPLLRQAADLPLDLSDPLISFYGPSFIQISQANVWPLHRLGYTGRNVIVCLLDSGFRTSHEIFRHARVIAQHDFVNGDDDVQQDPGNPDDYSDSHGTGTWSILGGFKPGELVGPAYGADFILAKTETDNFELPIEEDYWVAGIEWAESLGAEVVSSSLGYTDWYTFADMDGETAVTTRAANRAASLGVVVVNAAGNERDKTWGHIIAPADGFDVIACGAVDSLGRIASFSSPGPTYDGRIKPEICALGVRNWLAAKTEDGLDTYGRGSGTSFATPLLAGVAALLLEIHRDWTPAQVRSALLSTASRSDRPDNDYGWGIVDAASAADIGWTSLALEDYAVDDDATGESLGNANGRVEPGETIEVIVTLRNRGRSAIFGLGAALGTTHPDFILLSSTVAFPGIPAGESRSADQPFVVKVPSGFLGHQAVFWMKVEGPQGLELYENIKISISR